MHTPRILCVSHDPQPLQRIFYDAHVEVLMWPVEGVYGSGAKLKIETACSQIGDLSRFDCVVGTAAPSALVLFQLRRSGYAGPLMLIPHINPYPLRIFLQILLVAHVWGPADTVIVGSRTSAGMYERFFGMRTCVIPTFGIDTRLFAKRDRQGCRRELGLPDVPLITYTGRLARDKNVGDLLLAYQALRQAVPAVRLVLCLLSVDEEYLRGLTTTIGDAIILRGLQQEDMPSVYNAANLFVSCATSYYESFGRSPLESVACGTPVVVPEWNGFREYTHSGTGRLVPVDFFAAPTSDEWSYARVDLSHFAEACVRELEAPRHTLSPLDPKLAGIETALRMRGEMHRLLGGSSPPPAEAGCVASANAVNLRVVNALGVTSFEELFSLATAGDEPEPFLDRDMRREFYFALFKTS